MTWVGMIRKSRGSGISQSSQQTLRRCCRVFAVENGSDQRNTLTTDDAQLREARQRNPTQGEDRQRRVSTGNDERFQPEGGAVSRLGGGGIDRATGDKISAGNSGTSDFSRGMGGDADDRSAGEIPRDVD